MTVKNDKWIRESGVVSPCYEFTNEVPTGNLKLSMPPITETKKIISRGLSSYGYDLTCAPEFKMMRKSYNEDLSRKILDPKDSSSMELLWYCEADSCVIPSNSFVLTRSVEWIKMPRNIVGICMGKSTYARCGVVANTTLLEPEWEGHLVIELSNTNPYPVKIYANEGIVQVVFMEANELCETSYADRKGKYQNQQGIQEAKV